MEGGERALLGGASCQAALGEFEEVGASYLAALEGMEKQAAKLGVSPDWEGLCVEQVLELDDSLSGGIVLRVEVPVLREGGQAALSG